MDFIRAEHIVGGVVGLITGGSVVGVVVRMYFLRLVNRALETVTGDLIVKALADKRITDSELDEITASFRGQTTLFGEQGFGRQGP